MKKEIDPKDTTRAVQFEVWKHAPNPMITLVTKLDVTHLVWVSKLRHLKFNMLMNYCVGKAAADLREFYCLPVGDKMFQYDQLAINTMVRNNTGEVSSCDVLYNADLDTFNHNYLQYTSKVASSCVNRDLSEDYMVIGTSAIVDMEIEAAGGMYSGVFTNPLLIWGRYSRHWFRHTMNISFMFHHAQMDVAHAGLFLSGLQQAIDEI